MGRGLQIDCGCFSTGGPAAHVGVAQHSGELLRDLGLAAVSLALVKNADHASAVLALAVRGFRRLSRRGTDA